MPPVPTTPIRVLITSPFEDDQIERIRQAFPHQVDVVYEPSLVPRPRYPADHKGEPPALSNAEMDKWLTLLQAADVLLDLDWYAPSRLAELAPNVRWVQCTHSGVAAMLANAGLDKNEEIVFTTAAGVHGTPLAEFAVGALLYFVKEVPRLLQLQAQRIWDQRPTQELAGRKVLIVGAGGVGEKVASLCRGLDMEVWAAKRNVSEPPVTTTKVIPYESIQEALPEVDAVVLACPLTEETRGLLGREELGSLRPTAVLINLSRGAVLDEEALIDTLRERRILGAALDVFHIEPLPVDSPLWELDNVLISPHSAGLVDQENRRIVDLFIENLSRYLKGQPLINMFESTRGY